RGRHRLPHVLWLRSRGRVPDGVLPAARSRAEGPQRGRRAVDAPPRRIPGGGLMESVLLRDGRARPRPMELGLAASAVVLAGAAWALTGDRMAVMDAGPGTDLGGLGWFVGIWVTMMAAMMLPSVSPMVLAFARVTRER